MNHPLLWLSPALVAAAASAMPGSAQTPAEAAAHAIRAEALRAHLEFLASDALEGRGTGARGGDLAAKYVATQFERLGLRPAGENGTYFQTIPLQRRTFVANLAVQGGPRLKPGTDYVAYLAGPSDSAAAAGSSVFVGYGIVAPEERWDDYAGVDVTGKIVLALAGTPTDQDGSRFRGARQTPYAGREYKVREAFRHGAAAAFVIYHAAFRASWSEIAAAWTAPRLELVDSNSGLTHVAGWLNTPAARLLLAGAGESLADLVEAAGRPGFRARALGLSLAAEVRSSVPPVSAVNVLGRLPGRGPSADQIVLLGAHYDHLGIGPPIDGDSIYNGAIDNASGTAGMLAVAEACVSSDLEPGRSVIFVAFGAEEAGLLGSEAFVRRPTVPRDRLEAMLNLDGLNLLADTRDIAALGTDLSSLGTAFQRAAAAEGYALTPADSPIMREAVAQDFFNRSDQASFARAGVPVLFLYLGDTIGGAAPGAGKQLLDEYLARRYHRPNDDLHQPFDYHAGTHSLRVLTRTLVAIANAPQPPRWNPGSPYQH